MVDDDRYESIRDFEDLEHDLRYGRLGKVAQGNKDHRPAQVKKKDIEAFLDGWVGRSWETIAKGRLGKCQSSAQRYRNVLRRPERDRPPGFLDELYHTAGISRKRWREIESKGVYYLEWVKARLYLRKRVIPEEEKIVVDVAAPSARRLPAARKPIRHLIVG